MGKRRDGAVSQHKFNLPSRPSTRVAYVGIIDPSLGSSLVLTVRMDGVFGRRKSGPKKPAQVLCCFLDASHLDGLQMCPDRKG